MRPRTIDTAGSMIDNRHMRNLRDDPDQRQRRDAHKDTGAGNGRPRTLLAGVTVVALVAAVLALIPTSAVADTGDPIPGGGRAVPVGIGDFDGDGRQEAALIVPGRGDVVIIDVMTLDHETRTVASGAGPIGDGEPVGVADIDGDGRDDLVTTRSGDVDVWYRGLRNGTFARGVVLGAGDSGNALKAVGALDGFDAPAIMASLAPSGISGQPLRYRGLAGELVSIQTDTGPARFMVAGSFEPDDREQLRLFVDRTGPRTEFVSFRKEGTSVSGFVLSDIAWTLAETRSVTPADIGGDGLDDLVVQRRDGSIWVFTNDGNGDFGLIRRAAALDDVDTSTIEIIEIIGATDINGDGYNDVLALAGSVPHRFYGDPDVLLQPDRPADTSTCRGQAVTVSIGFGEAPTDGPDVIDGLGGNDIICALGGDDRIRAGDGRDWINGGSGADRLAGGAERDTIRGAAGRDRLIGGSGNDRLVGNRGSDVLRGQRGNDRCIGGPGRDRLGRGC